VIDDAGTLISQQRYLPFGQVREDVGSISHTDFGYTGQRELDEGMGGIMDYKARFYSPSLGRFIQPDTIIPSAANPQSWNRYSYVTNNALRYTDPTGHMQQIDDGGGKCDAKCLENLNKNKNKGKNKDKIRRQPGPRSTLVYDFQTFPEIPWSTNVKPIDSGQMQGFCYRNYGPDVECGRFPTRINTPSEINLRIDAMGIRIEASGWIVKGGDVNVDWLYFGTSHETGLFLSPGSQTGGGGGAALTGGILIGHNMPGRGSYSGVSIYGGGHGPVLPLGIDVEGEHSVSVIPNEDGTFPSTTYIGAGPIGEAGGYTGVSTTVSVTDTWTSAWNWLTGK
jgi:RHS repeat-associated protein